MGYYCRSKKKINTIYIMTFTHAPVTIEYIIMCSLISLEIIADISIIIFCIKALMELKNIQIFNYFFLFYFFLKSIMIFHAILNISIIISVSKIKAMIIIISII